MKVILLKDIPKIGKKYDIKDINDGHATNLLIPKKLVEPATPKRVAEIEAIKKGIQIEKNTQEGILNKNLEKISGLNLVIKGKASESGSLFSGIRKEDILEKMKKDHGVEISPEYLILEKPIKEIGEHSIPVQAKNKKVSFSLIIEKA